MPRKNQFLNHIKNTLGKSSSKMLFHASRTVPDEDGHEHYKTFDHSGKEVGRLYPKGAGKDAPHPFSVYYNPTTKFHSVHWHDTNKIYDGHLDPVSGLRAHIDDAHLEDRLDKVK